MRIFFREGIFLSFVIALLFSSAYSQDLDGGEPCTGALESIGRIACAENALCFQDKGAFTCVCRDNHFGDGWASGTGCNEGHSKDEPESGRVKRYVGLWSSPDLVETCKGKYYYFGKKVCARNAICYQGYRTSSWLRCICKSGRGNGISTDYTVGTGCR